MERCNSNRCSCNRRRMMNSNRSCPGSMLTDTDRRDNACDSMCESRDNNACMPDTDNKCGMREHMDMRNRREDNMECGCRRESDMRSDCRRDGSMERGCRRDNMQGSCRRNNDMRSGCRRECDMDSRCRMDNNMCNRRGNMNDMEGFALAMAYVPWQQWGEVYPLNTGLQRGTIFPELDKPFFKGRCCN